MSVFAAAGLVVGSSVLGAAAAQAEGPGYGGNAGDLSVSWTETSSKAWAAPPDIPDGGGDATDPNKIRLAPGDAALTILGMGFRAKTMIRIQVGDIANVERKTDTTGTLSVDIPANQVTGAAPGQSVLASGLSPSGTTRTLVGSVPPKPSGIGPSDIMPWVVGALAVGALAYTRPGLRKRRKDPDSLATADADAEGDADAAESVGAGTTV